jgi:hypothetical protein
MRLGETVSRGEIIKSFCTYFVVDTNEYRDNDIVSRETS